MPVVLPDADPLKSLCQVLQQAFPDGVAEAKYLALLRILTEEMSFRAAARAVEVAFGVDPAVALNDAYGVQGKAPIASELEAVRSTLNRAGDKELPDDLRRES